MPSDLLTRQDWTITYSGLPFFPLAPNPQDVRIADVGHALANCCRFAGHTREFYSVAQHSVLVSQFCAPDDALWGLLHDASEAYLCDLTRIVKRDPLLDGYRTLERRVQDAVCARFELDPDEPESVRQADYVLLKTEQRDLMSMPDGWTPKVTPLAERLTPWKPYEAEREFLRRFYYLLDQRGGGHGA